MVGEKVGKEDIMNNRMIRTVSAVLAASMMASLCACDIYANKQEEGNIPVVETDYVRIVDGVKPEMMNSEYWLDNEDNAVLMSDEQIKEFNRTNRVHVAAGDGPAMPYLDEFTDTLEGEALRVILLANESAVPEDPSQFYLNGEPTTAEYWDHLVELANLDAVDDVINVKFGYTVKRSTLRLFPTEDRVFDSPDDMYFDSLLYSECLPFMPVAVLHESLDGEYLYVVFDSYAAWVRKDAVAICESREDWLARQNPEHRLTVTGREIRLGDDPYCESTRDLVLPMGTYLELIPAAQTPDIVNQRMTFGNYVVKIPTRGEDGMLVDEFALIPMSDDVTVGFLPYTPANVVRQAFKLLGDRYGWGGDLRANDCTGITREVYRCFGILLPRTGQSAVEGVYRVDMSEMTDEQKLDVIKGMSPGSLLSFPGHIMMYLGMDNGVPYVISAVGTFVAAEPESEDKVHPDSVVINSLYMRRGNLNTWLGSIQTALTIK